MEPDFRRIFDARKNLLRHLFKSKPVDLSNQPFFGSGLRNIKLPYTSQTDTPLPDDCVGPVKSRQSGHHLFGFLVGNLVHIRRRNRPHADQPGS